jgi:hypothetical protein
LFQPEQAGAVIELPGSRAEGTATGTVRAAAEEAKAAETEKPTTTASRLLEAKKRAQKRRDQ